MPTSRNARGIDIIAYSIDAERLLKVQVKALSKAQSCSNWCQYEKVMGDFWIIVTDVTKEPCAFIMKPSEVKSEVHRGEKEGRISHWLQPSAYDKDDFREKWDRIGRGDEIIR